MKAIQVLKKSKLAPNSFSLAENETMFPAGEIIKETNGLALILVHHSLFIRDQR